MPTRPPKPATPDNPLGLGAAEWKAIKDCMWARQQVPNGHFLPSPRAMVAHGRMVERGFMTEVPEAEKGLSPPNPAWRVFKMTDENILAYNVALEAAKADHPEQGRPMTIEELRPVLNRVPRPALSDALLSLGIGPSNLRSLTKAVNVKVARDGLKGDKAQALADAIVAAWKIRDPVSFPG